MGIRLGHSHVELNRKWGHIESKFVSKLRFNLKWLRDDTRNEMGQERSAMGSITELCKTTTPPIYAPIAFHSDT